MEDRLPSRKTGSYYGQQAPIFTSRLLQGRQAPICKSGSYCDMNLFGHAYLVYIGGAAGGIRARPLGAISRCSLGGLLSCDAVTHDTLVLS